MLLIVDSKPIYDVKLEVNLSRVRVVVGIVSAADVVVITTTTIGLNTDVSTED